MKSSAKNIKLTSLDDLFETDESRAAAGKEQIVELPLEKLHEFQNHPFKVRDDEAMKDTVESVEKYGVLVPALVRLRDDGEYEIIAGHRRHRASQLAGKETMPCIVRDLDDDAATIVMVDSNLQREEILPSERAAAFKMKMEAIKRQGTRTDLTSPHNATRLRSDDLIAAEAGISGDTLQRIIRLNNLIPELLEMVDEKKLGVTPASEISFLSENEQKILLDAISCEQAVPSVSQAQKFKKMSQDGKLTEDTIFHVMAEQKKPPKAKTEQLVIPTEKLRSFFPKSYSNEKMEEVILKLLASWAKKRERNMER